MLRYEQQQQVLKRIIFRPNQTHTQKKKIPTQGHINTLLAKICKCGGFIMSSDPHRF